MTAQDWYRRAVGGARQAPGSPQAYVPQHQVPAGYTAPPGYQLVPIQQTGTVPWQAVQPQVPNVDTSTIPRGAVTPENFVEMAKYWKGGQGNKSALPCPACGGTMFRRFVGNLEARPLCESCNYNGTFTQGEGAMA